MGVKLKRTNWGQGEPLVRLTKAVEVWDAKTGDILEANPTMTLKAYAAAVEIPYPTMQDYACKDLGKRHALGTRLGKAPLFTQQQQQFVVDVIVRHDRGNDGLNKRQCVDQLSDLRPDLPRKKVVAAFDRTVRTVRCSPPVRRVTSRGSIGEALGTNPSCRTWLDPLTMVSGRTASVGRVQRMGTGGLRP